MSPVIGIICGVMLTIGAVCALARAERGPSILDRVVAVDVVVATILATVALISAWTGRSDLVPVLVVLALVGFIGSVTLARFSAAESDDERRILTPEEAKAQAAARWRAEMADDDAEAADLEAAAAQADERAENTSPSHTKSAQKGTS